MRFSGFAIGAGRSHVAFRGFLPRKTTPRDLYGTTVIAKPLLALVFPGLQAVRRRHRIDAALEKLVAVRALTAHTEPTAGRPSTLWSVIADDRQEDKEESAAESEEPAENK